ncbi:hypothetical protein YC2023_077729 [Brassica napus]
MTRATTTHHLSNHALPPHAATDTMRYHWESQQIGTQPDHRRTHTPPIKTTGGARGERSLTRENKVLSKTATATPPTQQDAGMRHMDSKAFRRYTQLHSRRRSAELKENGPDGNPRALRRRRLGSATAVLKQRHLQEPG